MVEKNLNVKQKKRFCRCANMQNVQIEIEKG